MNDLDNIIKKIINLHKDLTNDILNLMRLFIKEEDDIST